MKASHLGMVPLVIVGLSFVLASCKYEAQIGSVKAEAETYWGKGPIAAFTASIPEKGGNTMVYHAYIGLDGTNPFILLGRGPKCGP